VADSVFKHRISIEYLQAEHLPFQQIQDSYGIGNVEPVLEKLFFSGSGIFKIYTGSGILSSP